MHCNVRELLSPPASPSSGSVTRLQSTFQTPGVSAVKVPSLMLREERVLVSCYQSGALSLVQIPQDIVL